MASSFQWLCMVMLHHCLWLLLFCPKDLGNRLGFLNVISAVCQISFESDGVPCTCCKLNCNKYSVCVCVAGFKANFKSLQQLVLIGGPDDGVITPWQSRFVAVAHI